MDDGGLAAEALLERERERLAHVLEALPFAQARAGATAVTERACRLGQTELGGEPQRSLCRGESPPESGFADPVPPASSA